MCLQLAKIPHLDILLYMLVDNICWCDGMAVNSKYTLVFFACYLECRAKGCSKSLISSLFFVIIHKLYRIWFLIIEICVTDLKVFPNGKNSLVTPKQPFTIEPPPPLFFYISLIMLHCHLSFRSNWHYLSKFIYFTFHNIAAVTC